MAAGFRTCRICGARYEYCRTKRDPGLFRWQDVACCPEHGAAYFAQIAASRSAQPTPAPAPAGARAAALSPAPVYDEEDETDPLFEEGFDDGEEELEVEL